MRCPPLLLCLGIGKRRFPIWLPLFLLWPVAVAVAIALLPLGLLLLLILWFFGWGKLVFLTGPRLLSVLCALRGLEVNLDKGNSSVLIVFK
jgi:hypothetical protein